MSGAISEWTKPGPVLAVFGWIGLVFTSYDGFKDASEKQAQEVIWRLQQIEKKNDEQEIHLKSTDGFVQDHGLRIDRLEHLTK